jgi:hypothetical protein
MNDNEIQLLSFLADLRIALGDNGKRMQPELIKYAKELAKDAARYQWLRNTQNTEVRDDEEFIIVGTVHDIYVSTGGFAEAPNANELDALIDAAIAK